AQRQATLSHPRSWHAPRLSALQSAGNRRGLRSNVSAWRSHRGSAQCHSRSGAGTEGSVRGAIKLDLERKLGEMIPKEFPNHRPEKASRRVTLKDAGISRMQSHRFQQVAKISREEYERAKAEIVEARQELTTVALAQSFCPRFSNRPEEGPDRPHGVL